MAAQNRDADIQRAAQELKDGYYANLGIGMPTLIPDFVPEGRKVWLQSENGILGMGPLPTKEQVDPDIIVSSSVRLYTDARTRAKRPSLSFRERPRSTLSSLSG